MTPHVRGTRHKAYGGVVGHAGRLAWSMCVVRVALMMLRGRADDVMHARGPLARSRGLEQVNIVTVLQSGTLFESSLNVPLPTVSITRNVTGRRL